MGHQRRTARASSLVAAALGLGALAPMALASTAATASTPRLFQFAAAPSGSWSASSTHLDAAAAGRPIAVTLGASHLLVGISSVGHLTVASDDGAGTWSTVDVTQATTTTTTVGVPTAVVDPSGQLRVFARSTANHLIELDRSTGGTWSGSDLSAGGLRSIGSNPDAAVTAGGRVAVAWRTPGGHLEVAEQQHRRSHRLTGHDLTSITSGPAVAGSPSLLPTSRAGASLVVAARASNGDLLELADDNRHLTIWTSYDLSSATGAGEIVTNPSLTRVEGRLAVLGVRADGSVLVVSSVNPGDQHLVAADLTAGTQTKSAVTEQVAAVPIAGRLVAAVRTTTNHLLVYSADPASGFLSISATDVSSQSATGVKIAGAPSLADAGGVPAAYAPRFIPPPPPPPTLAATIVAIAQGQDQFAAKVAETPAGSNCNPYTAYWGRGVSKGCAGGTSAEAWCSDFAQWVWVNAGADVSGISGWSYSFVDNGIAHGTFKPGATNNPQPGDAVVFGDAKTKYGSHVGIVTAVNGAGQIDMVSGNWQDAVMDSGFFDPAGPNGAGYPIIGYITPVAQGSGALRPATTLAPSQVSQAEINTQDQGR
jgi:CHAP domain